MTGEVTTVKTKLFYRYSQFYMEDSFCHYNMFNHHFFDGKVRINNHVSFFFYCISALIFLGSLKSRWWLFHHLLTFIFVLSLSAYRASRGDCMIHLSWLHCFLGKIHFRTKASVALCDLTPPTLQPVLSSFLLCSLWSGHMIFIANWPLHHRGSRPCCSVYLVSSLPC